MKVSVHFTEEVTTPFQEGFLTRVAAATLKRCPLKGLSQKEEISLNAVAVSRERIQELNKTYRGVDKVTDILSFGEYGDTTAIESDTGKTAFLGELFFCQDVIAAAAQEDQITAEHEMIYLFSHGVLHLLGYDHSDEMFAIQDAVTESLMTRSKT